MKIIKILSIVSILVLVLSSGLMAQVGQYKIVVNKDNPVSSLSQKEISNLFLKKVTKWSNGLSVQPVDLADTSPVREKFSKEIHNRKVSSIKAYWQKQIFSGRKVPPAEKKSNREILIYLQNNPGAVGYVSAATNINQYQVKILQTKK